MVNSLLNEDFLFHIFWSFIKARNNVNHSTPFYCGLRQSDVTNSDVYLTDIFTCLVHVSGYCGLQFSLFCIRKVYIILLRQAPKKDKLTTCSRWRRTEGRVLKNRTVLSETSLPTQNLHETYFSSSFSSWHHTVQQAFEHRNVSCYSYSKLLDNIQLRLSPA